MRTVRSGSASPLTVTDDEGSGRHYRELYDESPIGLFGCRPDGRYVAANPAFVRMLGYASEAELLRSAPALSTGSTSTPIFTLTDLGAERVADREIEVLRGNGAPATLRIWLRPIVGTDGDLERVEGIAEDITERRVLERRLLEAQRVETIGHLAGGVAHDFNNLLTVILASAQLGLHALDSEDDLREHLKDIEAAARSGSLVTRQLLTFARRDRNEPTSVDVNESLRSVQRLIRRLISERVHVTLDLEGSPLRALVDRGRLEQVIINLAVNARDAMPEGGTLTFRTRSIEDGRQIEICVQDTGDGMSEDVRSRAFEPFFTTKARGQGTGLGLAAVHGIIKDANGEIVLESEEGSGTTVRIRLPWSDAALDVSAPTGGGVAVSAGATVLVVEDGDEVRKATIRLLESAGLTVFGASDGATAIEVASTTDRPFDLALIDVTLPDLTARAVLQGLRRVIPDLAVIFTSGYPLPLTEEASAVRADDVLLEKPFTLEELTEAVVTALSKGPAAMSGG